MSVATQKRHSTCLNGEEIVAKFYVDISSDISDKEPDDSSQTSDNGSTQFYSVTLHKDLCSERQHSQKHHLAIF
jgi:hypothetical protein